MIHYATMGTSMDAYTEATTLHMGVGCIWWS